MNIKKYILSFFLLISLSLFSQEVAEKRDAPKPEIKISYLDSIKKTFVRDDLASCVDSLWLKELTDLDLYNNLSQDIQTINFDEQVDYELPTEVLKARLQEMDEKSPFHIEYNPGLENIIKSFLKNRKRAFERLMAISEYYFPLFEEALDKQNVPLEIKYLAVVESALNPKAVSRVGATGLWQFMYQTGKQYGLKIDSYVDERSDPLKASEAAAQYMKNMYAIFGDWDLVLASYNSGPGNVAKAIRRSGGQQNYWNIRKNLPKETQGYVPAFLATMYIYEYHKEHGIKPERAPIKHFATDTVMIKKQISFKQISDLIDIPIAQLQILNPSFKLNIVPSYKDQAHYLRLPQDKMAVFTSNESKIYAYVDREANLREKPFQIVRPIVPQDSINTLQRLAQAKVRYYRVKRGDNLTTIAQKYDVAIEDLKKWNNIKGNKVAYGKNLRINGTDVEQKLSAVAKVEVDKKAVIKDSLGSKMDSFYVVQKGDNLSAIAKKFNISVADLQEWNKLTNNNIQLGASLQIAKNSIKEDVVAAPERKDIQYVVQKGDNLGNIAKKFGVSLDDLKQWNNLTTNSIALGSTLIVAKNEIAIVTNKAPVASFKKKEEYSAPATEYYVKKGDSLYSISKKYPGVTISDLKKWNNIKDEELKPGMKLKING
ncbi:MULTISPECIES: LysM peptidoglycan-binding domain-containing protein [Flavobacterium]|uniref:LysM peptidoglycan-binding domain-containing protein n=1 Tax=Flavobacterium keumense TaxID=1306518 RepID=A0ABY8N6T3_9FLAO|nr:MULTISPECIES: LysM peptidoglycan-binding domain-containing protein [Flavobacterium]WGK95257.1 LysM peptidoglycan-binding domain-containing protein [Flavobacterium keumense]